MAYSRDIPRFGDAATAKMIVLSRWREPSNRTYWDCSSSLLKNWFAG